MKEDEPKPGVILRADGVPIGQMPGERPKKTHPRRFTLLGRRDDITSVKRLIEVFEQGIEADAEGKIRKAEAQWDARIGKSIQKLRRKP